MSSQLRLSGWGGERLSRLVARCGTAAHLVPDTLLVADDLQYCHPAGRQALIARSELGNAADWLKAEPLLSALQDGRAIGTPVECQHCQPCEPLKVVYNNYSGSYAEELDDLALDERCSSDLDIMLELGGPFSWAEVSVAGEEPDLISARSAPQIWARPTGAGRSPGSSSLSSCTGSGHLSAAMRPHWQRCRPSAYGN